MPINFGFKPKRESSDRLPPGQYLETDFPVLSLGPTPQLNTEHWTLNTSGLVTNPVEWTWDEFNKLAQTEFVKDIHCVTKWSKFDTKWSGVSFDEIINLAGVKPEATHLIAHSYDGYTTNIPVADLIHGQAMVALKYEGQGIAASHGGPARIVLPHLYFWKSAKWVKKLEFVQGDQPGFWETRGYHNYGDPWKEERYG
jgi:DMSO/TMAO reductase YedYZ molybdopterin-dependent catalytic subunit